MLGNPAQQVVPLSVALITVGQPRTIAHPAAAASFALMRTGLLHDGHVVSHFMWLTPSSTPLDEGSRPWQQTLAIYEPRFVRVSNETLECRPQCRIRCDTNGHDTQINWLRQFFAVHRAYRAVREYSEVHGTPFDWYIKLRPDLFHLQPLRSLSSFSRSAAYVPRGIMTRAPADQLNNDHIIVCPAGELCDRYFDTFERTYGSCTDAFRMRWPWQRLFSGAFAKESLRLFDHAYTLARAGSAPRRVAGPECQRLSCSKDPHSTGCVAPHLVRFVPRCDIAAREWNLWETLEPTTVLRRLESLPPEAPVPSVSPPRTEDNTPRNAHRRRLLSSETSGAAAAFHGTDEYVSFMASIPPLPCRDDFAVLAQRRFVKTGRAAEIGVYVGTFAAQNLKVWQGEYYAIDAWQWRPNDPREDKNYARKAENDANFERARRAMAFAGERVKQIRALSVEATTRFDDGSFDWLYIDALHTEAALLQDLRAWWPKLRPGGLFTGDDYGDENATEWASEARYAKVYAKWGSDRNVPKKHHWGVMRATHAFAKEVGVPLQITWMRDCYNWPAWWMVKPA